MNATWIFASAKLKRYNKHEGKVEGSDDQHQVDHVIKMMKMKRKEKGGLDIPTIVEEEHLVDERWKRKLERPGGKKMTELMEMDTFQNGVRLERTDKPLCIRN
ncbi:hypothetical protein SLA2020_279960 [Shorea laevis]